MHRLVDAKKQQDNRDHSIAECNDVLGQLQRNRLAVRRVPFRLYRRGIQQGDDRYSVRLIESTDNEAGGRRLNSMYTLNRILDGDPFYVKITN